MIETKLKYRFNEEINPETGKKNHLHELNVDSEWKPLIGTSTVTQIISKPLTYWAAEKTLNALGWLHPKKAPPNERIISAGMALLKLKDISLDKYLELLDNAYHAHRTELKDKAEKGIDLHAAAELQINAVMKGEKIKAIKELGQFDKWANENIKRFLGSELHCYNSKLWVGGISDGLFEDKQEKIGILDFKSHREAYETDFVQCAGYDLQFQESGGLTPDGKQIVKPLKVDYYMVWAFGSEEQKPAFRYNLEQLRKSFRAALFLHKLINKI